MPAAAANAHLNSSQHRLRWCQNPVSNDQAHSEDSERLEDEASERRFLEPIPDAETYRPQIF